MPQLELELKCDSGSQKLSGLNYTQLRQDVGHRGSTE